MVVPLALSGRLVGVMNASREPGASRMDESTARLLELLANQAAILIDSVQMLEELQRKDQRLEQLVDQLLGETGRRPATSIDLLAPLTRREQQVLELLVDGLTNREIALRLVVEPDTVKDHVQSIIKKLANQRPRERADPRTRERANARTRERANVRFSRRESADPDLRRWAASPGRRGRGWRLRSGRWARSAGV